jgi:Tol biopolymer transport system component
MRNTLLLRSLLRSLSLAFVVAGCRSTTDSTTAELPIVVFEGCCLNGQLVLMSEDASFRRVLLDLPQAFVQYPRWSPDGQRIAFHQQASAPQGPGGIFVVNADGSGLREILPPSGRGFAGVDWSPDGTQLVTYSGNGIAVVGQNGGGFAQLAPTNASAIQGRGLSWSPDGKEILYNGTHNTGGGPVGPDVWVFNIATGASRILASPGLDGRWSPDGRQVAYIHVGFGNSAALGIVGGDGSNPRSVLLGGTASPLPEFAWSPDGRRILYEGELAPCGCRELYTISVDLIGGASNITRNPPGRYARYPDWRWSR